MKLWIASLRMSFGIVASVSTAAARTAGSTHPLQHLDKSHPAGIVAADSGPVRSDRSGEWDFRFDPKGQGESEAWLAPGLHAICPLF